MTEILIYPRTETEVLPPEARSARLTAWQAATGLTLPEDFARFHRDHDGGFPFPATFPITDPAALDKIGEDLIEIFELYDWPRVVSHHRKDTYGAGTPDEFLLIGDANGGLQIALSLRTADYGQVFIWPHTTIPWGDTENDDARLVPLAVSFRALIEALEDDGDPLARDLWDANGKARAARPIQF